MAYDAETNAALQRLPGYNSDPYRDPGNLLGMDDYGHIINFPKALADFTKVAKAIPQEISIVTQIGAAAQASATTAAAAATQSQASAVLSQTAKDAAVAAAAAAAITSGATGTSNTPLALTPGLKALTTQAGKNWVVGMSIALSSTGDPLNRRMGGLIGSYDAVSGAMEVLIATDDIIGGGTYADWVIGPSGRRGARGSDGSGSTIQMKVNNVAVGSPTPIINIAGDTVSGVLDPGNNTVNIVIAPTITLAQSRWLSATSSL